MKPKFIETNVLKQLRKNFPKCNIVSYKKFKAGLVNQTYKVMINNPRKTIAVRMYKSEKACMTKLNIKLMKYLYKKKLPVPKIYSNDLFAEQGILIMEYINGKNALLAYKSGSSELKRNLLTNLGKLMRKIHQLEIPEFWIHHRHEIKNKKEWIKWTELRIEKYLKFAQANLDVKYYSFLKEEFIKFSSLLNKDIEFVPMHWDYHLDNVLVNDQEKIIGVFDFDNSLKGHNLADIGQTMYWLRFQVNDYRNFIYFLKGYHKKTTEKDRILIRGYFLLHLIAVTRSIWSRKRKFGWIISKHKKILDEIMRKEI
ncbi:MAG TPA: aminoglycoside phosphotransferase family protein [Candidatus Nanoarchaeia archaeon]|nr:aminoglycoside phosphotransferase family protein [Candidatus Nanoarchaeia archaeon]